MPENCCCGYSEIDWVLVGDRYSIQAHGCDGTLAYDAEQIDLLVAPLIPEDTGYMIPVEAFTPKRHGWWYPRGTYLGTGKPGSCWGLGKW
jgi:hypothetical protein